MLKKVNSKKGHARLGAGLALLTVFGSVGLSAVPAAFATTAPTQQATNLAQFTNLVTMLNGLNSTLSTEGNLSAVETFTSALSTVNWQSVLYGTSPSATQGQMNNGIAFFKPFLSLFLNNIEAPVSTTPDNITALEATVLKDIQVPNSNTTITGTDLYNFYVNFRNSAISQIMAGTSISGGSADSLNTVVDNALVAAVQSNSSVFSGLLGKFGLSIQDIPTIRQNIMKIPGAPAALNAVVSGFVVPNLTTGNTMNVGGSQLLSFSAQNVGLTLKGFQMPASWFSVTQTGGNANVTITQNNSTNVISITANSAGSVTLTPMLRGYTLAPITLNISAVGSSGGSTAPAGGGGSTGGGSTTPPANTNPNGTTNFQSTVNTAAFTLALVTQTIPAAGGSINITSGNSSLAVTAPAGALAPGETVSLSSAPVSSVQTGVPTGQTAVAAFGVNFSGAAPNSAITLQIKNKDIPSTALVYKVMPDGTWVPVAATVVNGVLTLSFSTDPDFVISNPNLQPDQRQILWSGQQEQVAHSFVAKDPVHGNMTTFMPIWYAMQVLKQQGINSTWNGKVWNLSTTGTSITPDLTKISAGTGSDAIEINGTLVQNAFGQVSTDPKHGNKTTFMPIYWVFQALTRLGYDSSWNGTTWDITKAPASTTTTTN